MGSDSTWSRRRVLKTAAGLGVAASAVRRATAAPKPPPNIVFILSDNHRWDAMSSMAHPFVKTPHMDRIGSEGIHFDNAFCTTPLCSPARASFLTGLYAYEHGIHNHTTKGRWDEQHTTFLELLARDSGYHNAFIGKWHMPGSPPPSLRGVEKFTTFVTNGGQGRYLDCPLIDDGREVPSRKQYISEELTDRAIEYIEQRRKGPFCVYLSHKAAHHPWTPATPERDIYRDAPVPMPAEADNWTGLVNGQIWGGFTEPIEVAYRRYMETVTSMDREIGRLLDAMEAMGVLDETIVIYASDNGFLFGERKRVELRWPFEAVLRIPFVLRAPHLVTQPGRRAEQLALNIDIAPTLLELAGITPPTSMHGRSLRPILQSPDAPSREAFLVENYKEFPYRVPEYHGIRTRQYLYVEYEKDFGATLHDVVRDPGQHHDLAGTAEGKRVAAKLRDKLAALRSGRTID